MNIDINAFLNLIQDCKSYKFENKCVFIYNFNEYSTWKWFRESIHSFELLESSILDDSMRRRFVFNTKQDHDIFMKLYTKG
jgi:hypothetical protein